MQSKKSVIRGRGLGTIHIAHTLNQFPTKMERA